VSRFLGVGPDGIRLGDPEFIRWSATQVSRVLARAASAQGEGGGPGARDGGEASGD
jgi:hypothetical protein